jgi:NAD(P)-dependent dehydrogenase (short-subunit alcohol dehydrogenase family)
MIKKRNGKLLDKVYIVTGGAMGIGKSIVKLLVSKGFKVVIGDIADKEGKELEKELNQFNKCAYFVHTDVTQSNEIKRLIESAIEHFCHIDGLVNNAGITIAKSTLDLSEEEWDLVINLNLKSTWLCSKYAIPYLSKRKGSAIVNVASSGGLVGFPNLAAYCASKGGVIQFTKACALDCAPLGIRVNAVAPGHTRTPMGEGFVNAQKDPSQFEIEHINKRHPLGRMAEPEEIAAAISFLLSSDASFITGSILCVDGGYVAT